MALSSPAADSTKSSLVSISTEDLILELNKRVYSQKLVESQQKIVISVDGCIGAGKTTLLRKLKEKYGSKICFVEEPTKNWTDFKDEKGTDILSLFYSDKLKYAFLFQILAYITRARALYQAYLDPNNEIIIMERSIETDRHIFAKKMNDDGFISKVEWEVYTHIFDFLNLQITSVMFVDTVVEECDRRIKLRHRSGEDHIPIEYLESLITYHKSWLDERENVYTIDGSRDFNDENLLDEVYAYILTLKDARLNTFKEYIINRYFTEEMIARLGRLSSPDGEVISGTEYVARIIDIIDEKFRMVYYYGEDDHDINVIHDSIYNSLYKINPEIIFTQLNDDENDGRYKFNCICNEFYKYYAIKNKIDLKNGDRNQRK